MPRTTRFPDVPNQVHVATVHYDADLDGGNIGEKILPGTFPAGALFFNGICHILQSLTEEILESPLIGLKLGDADLVAPEGFANWNAGLKVTDVLLPGDYNPALLEEDANLSIVISGGTLVSGKIAIHLMYVMSPAMPVQLMRMVEEEIVVEDTAPPDDAVEETPTEEDPAPDPIQDPEPEPCPEPESEATAKSSKKKRN